MSATVDELVTAGAVVFEVVGTPRAQGSKQAFVHRGRAVMVDRRRSTLLPWRDSVTAAAAGAIATPLAGPVAVWLTFTLTRPRSHYRSGRHADELREDAPTYLASRPDVDKLARAVLDALTGVAFRDDGQVAELTAAKLYGDRAGVRVELRLLADRA